MAGKITLQSPELTLILGAAESPDDWTQSTVQTFNGDFRNAELLFATRKWGRPQDRPMQLNAAIAYYAMRRLGRFGGTWDEFESLLLDVSVGQVDESFPTPPGPDPESS
jgi:hypothetical protein